MNDNNELHVVPIGDLLEHEIPRCWCDYETEEVSQTDGGSGTIVVHRAIDGRE